MLENALDVGNQFLTMTHERSQNIYLLMYAFMTNNVLKEYYLTYFCFFIGVKDNFSRFLLFINSKWSKKILIVLLIVMGDDTALLCLY